jgi:pimeloyl-ACP methyl ester carboxylesterase
MPQVTANGLSIEFDERGDPDAPVVLLVMGLGAQMVLWPAGFCDLLAERGFRAIRFDNRDIGLSEKLDREPVPDIQQVVQGLISGKPVEVPYLLGDMAADTVGLMDALDVSSAHVVGASMGGMIAQIVAAHYPDRVRTLTSIMSTSGRMDLPQGKPEAMQALLTMPPGNDKASVAEHSVRLAKIIGSPDYPVSDEALRQFAEMLYDRSYYPAGPARQYAAVLASGSRDAMLPDISAPTLVIHGDADPLLPVEHGQDTAQLVPGARLEVIEGMGHNLPPQLYEKFADMIASHAKAQGG